MLSVNNLSVSFVKDGITSAVIDEISFHIAKGETLGLTGESGCGKTVTSLALLRLLQKENSLVRGNVLFDHNTCLTDILASPEKNLQQIRGKEIAMIFQEPLSALNPVITCGKQIAEVLIKHEKLSSKDVFEKTLLLLEKVNISQPKEMFSRYPHELSGGQLQRMMIAMAISCNPKLLIADEPTTALDVTTQRVILKLLKDIQQEYQTAMLFISHDLKVMKQVADRVMVMQKGKIVEEGKTEELFKNPKHDYTRLLLESEPSRLFGIVKKTTQATNSEISEVHKKEKPFLLVSSVNKQYIHYKSPWSLKRTYIDAVKNVSFSLKSGESLGVAGESGSGKSTLARILLQLIPSDGGEIYFKGEKLKFQSNKNRKCRKNIQIVFQHPHQAMDPLMTVGRTMEEPLIAFRKISSAERKKTVLSWLEKVGLAEHHYNRYPHELSTGQKQRVCIAKSLIASPDVVVFDEAVSALDVTVQAQILKLIHDLKSNTPFSSIFISHNMEVLRQMCERLLIMHKGEVIEHGETEKIFHKPQHVYTQLLIDSIL